MMKIMIQLKNLAIKIREIILKKILKDLIKNLLIKEALILWTKVDCLTILFKMLNKKVKIYLIILLSDITKLILYSKIEKKEKLLFNNNLLIYFLIILI